MDNKIYDYLDYSVSGNSDLLNEVADKTNELIQAIRKLRTFYKEKGELPLTHIHTDFDNMFAIAEIIEEEALKFGVPMHSEKSYRELSQEELDELKNDPDLLADLGLKEWAEEGLL